LLVFVGERQAFPNPGYSVLGGVWYHEVIVLVPDNPNNFLHNPLFTQTQGAMATVAGEPSYSLDVHPGNLRSDFNNYTDNPYNLQNLTVVNPPFGMSDSQFINAIADAAFSYRNDLPYQGVPAYGKTYNSNGYVAGVLMATGATVPDLHNWMPGGDNPIPLAPISPNRAALQTLMDELSPQPSTRCH